MLLKFIRNMVFANRKTRKIVSDEKYRHKTIHDEL